MMDYVATAGNMSIPDAKIKGNDVIETRLALDNITNMENRNANEHDKKQVKQQIHTNGSPEKKDGFEDVSQDEIVIPDHMISQVHSNVNRDDSKRLSTVTTSSYTKKAKKNYVGPWKLGRTLGRGATGRVRLAKHNKTGQLAAVKIIPKSTFKEKGHGADNSGIEREIIIMKLISHPNIMALYDVWENRGELYLILEYVESGELFNYLIKQVRLEEREAVHYFKQIISGINYCHSFNICHRDLKPENLLLDKFHNIKIADFGMAALEVTNKMLKTSCGSPHYASPEVVMGESYHGAPSDIWSCGIILFALLTGHLPFDDDHLTRLLAKVRSGIFRIPSYVSLEARDLIKRMLTINPEKRITMEEILKHPLLLKYPDMGYYYPRSKKSKNYMEPPLPKDIMKKPIEVDKIDKEILKNLQTLWHGEKKAKVIEKLMSSDENAEKLFYYLLLKYRQEHSEEASKSNKAKKKSIMQTEGEVTGRDLINDKKLSMTKSQLIVSTTFTDGTGNRVTQISTEPLSTRAKARSTSYKKLANSKYSLLKVNGGELPSSHSNSNMNKRKTRDIEGNLIISASSSFRKGISFHSRVKSSSSFKSFKNSSPYNSIYNIKSYRNIDSLAAEGEKEPSEVIIKSTSKRDSFHAFSMGSIPNYAALIDQLATSNSQKSLLSPKKKQRMSLNEKNVAEANETIKRGKSKRSILNDSTSKRSVRLKNKSTQFPQLPQLPAEETKARLSTNDFAFFCEQVFGKSNSTIEDELKKEQENLRKVQQRIEAIKTNSVNLKVQELKEKARKLELENQGLLQGNEKRSSLSNASSKNTLTSSPKQSVPSPKRNPKKKKSILGVNSTLLNSAVQLTNEDLTDKFLDAVESLGRQSKSTSVNSNFNFNMINKEEKKKPVRIFNFGEENNESIDFLQSKMFDFKLDDKKETKPEETKPEKTEITRNSIDGKSPVKNRFSGTMVPHRDAPKPPTQQPKTTTPTTKTHTTKSIVAKGANIIVNASATTTSVTNDKNDSAENASVSSVNTTIPESAISNTAPSVSSPTTATSTTTATASQSTASKKDDDFSVKSKLQNQIDSSSVAESKISKTPSSNTTTASSILTNPKAKQSWFSKVINNFVPSASHSEEFRYESFLVVEDVQMLIRNSLTLRLKEGSVSKVKFDSIGIACVVPAKLAGGRSLKVKITIKPVKLASKAEQRMNLKRKSVVIVVKEKGSAKAFSNMGEAIQLTIQNEENQFKARESRIRNDWD